MTDILNLDEILGVAETVKAVGCTDEEKQEIKADIEKLKEALSNNNEALGLAAPQIGINKQILAIKFNDSIKVFINPIIKKKQGGAVKPETCLSLPGKEVLIGRPEDLTIVYYTEDLKYEDNKLLGPAARIFEQLIQILQGTLAGAYYLKSPEEIVEEFKKIGNMPTAYGLVSEIERDGSFADLQQEDLKEILAMYSRFNKVIYENIEKLILQDEELTTRYKQFLFTEKALNGEVEVVNDELDRKAAAQKQTAARVAASAVTASNAYLNANRKQFLNRKGK